MAKAITLRVLTQEGLAFEADAVSVIAPGEPGYLGVLHDHAPLVTTLKPGTLTWRTPESQTRRVRIGTGLLEVVKNQLTILASSVSDPQPVASSA